MNRRKFLNYVGCGCCGFVMNACSTAPITDRRQFKIIPEDKLNAQAAQIYEKVKEKEKMSDDKKTLNEIKTIGKKMEDSISEYFKQSNLNDPTINFDWEYILIDKKIKNAWCMPGGKIAIYTGILDVTKNTNGLAAVMGHEIAHAVAKHSVERASRGVLLNTSTRLIDIFSGGKIAIYTGILDVTKNTNGLAAVMGHEIAHAVAKHSVERASRGMLLNTSTQLIDIFTGGKLSQVNRVTGMNTVGLLSQIGIMNPFTRGQESEADYLGMIFASLSGYDIRETKKLWERMKDSNKGKEPPEFMSTHPSSTNRIKNLSEWENKVILDYPPITLS